MKIGQIPLSRYLIRREEPQDQTAIRNILLEAFPESVEADLVDRLRSDGDVEISIVALHDDEIVGHLLLSRMRGPFTALGLAPLAVLENHRNKGLGADLIRKGIGLARQKGGVQAVFVLGDPQYYRRFGFRSDLAAGFESPYAGPYLMVLPLADDSLPSNTGRFDYAPAFARFE